MYILQYHAFFQSVKSRNIFFVKQKKKLNDLFYWEQQQIKVYCKYIVVVAGGRRQSSRRGINNSFYEKKVRLQTPKAVFVTRFLLWKNIVWLLTCVGGHLFNLALHSFSSIIFKKGYVSWNLTICQLVVIFFKYLCQFWFCEVNL